MSEYNEWDTIRPAEMYTPMPGASLGVSTGTVPLGTWDYTAPANSISYTMYQPPKPVGYWVLYPGSSTCTTFAVYSKPTDEQIKNTETLLGWGWKDYDRS